MKIGTAAQPYVIVRCDVFVYTSMVGRFYVPKPKIMHRQMHLAILPNVQK